LSKVLNEISKETQVIITTHSPLLIDKKNVDSNIIVNRARAKTAKKIAEVRDILGVRVTDNLTTASLILLCEGVEDKRILNILIRNRSEKINRALDNNMLVIAEMGGGTNLSYNSALYQNFMCQIVAFLDDDPCGRNAFIDAKKKGHIDYSDVKFSKCLRRTNSEIEDMIDSRLYLTEIENKYNVKIDSMIFDDRNVVWSDRLKTIFERKGNHWDDRVEFELKLIVIDKVEKYPDKCLKKGCEGPIEDLVRILEEKLV
jgi:predicted ATP-dependent endonuclease of OLD family